MLVIQLYLLHALSNSVVKSWKSVDVDPGSSVGIMGIAVDTLEVIAASVVVLIVVLVVVGTVVVVVTVVGTVVVVMTLVGTIVGVEVVTMEVKEDLI